MGQPGVELRVRRLAAEDRRRIASPLDPQVIETLVASQRVSQVFNVFRVQGHHASTRAALQALKS